jgi:general secretion pathway protein A
MYVSYYKLAEQPFGVTPDPRFLFLTPSHREAMASIQYGVMENRGFSALIAPPGMGKTTLLFDLLQRLKEAMRTVFLFQFQPSPEGLMRSLLAELDIPDDGADFTGMQEKLNQAILAEARNGKRIVVVVDEAQNFREPVLEVLRMLSNFETSTEKLLHIVLSGQPQLAEMLAAASIQQLRQRISIIAALQPLDAQQTRQYIDHRLRVAGYHPVRPLFSDAASDLIAEYSGGIPRNINNLCFNSLSLGCALRRERITPELVKEVSSDLDLRPRSANPPVAERRQSASPNFAGLPNIALMPPPPARKKNSLAPLAAVLCVVALLVSGGVFANRFFVNPAATSAAPPAPQPPPAVQQTTQDTTVSVPADSDDSQTTQSADETPPKDDKTPQPVATPAPERAVSGSPRKAEIPVRPVKLVTVAQPQSLYRLCFESMDVCNSATLREIFELNPGLASTDQLRVGQKVRMPIEASRAASPKSQRVAENRFHSGEKLR